MRKAEHGFASIYGKDPDWATVIHAIDANKDGQIDYDEFITAAADRAKLLNEDNLKAAFRILDKNSDGTIDAEEIKTAFARGNLTELQAHGVSTDDAFWEKLLTEIDQNNDGVINFDEFEAYMMKLIDQGHYLERSEQASQNGQRILHEETEESNE